MQHNDKNSTLPISRRALLASGAAAVLAPWAHAQGDDAAHYPTRLIRLVAGYPAGGAADAQARLLASKLGEVLGQPVVVENRAGAAGSLGADVVAKAPADGYTILLAASSIFAINPWLYKKLPFDVERDFALVGQLASFQSVVVVPNNSPYKTLKDVVADARANPDKVSYGSPGTGTTAHLSAELLRRVTKVSMVHVPYKGDAPLLTDVIGTQIPLAFVNMAPALPLIETGRLRALAVTGATRAPSLPQVPTMEEQGFPGTAVVGWSGLAVRAGTAPSIISKLSNALRDALRNAQLRERFLAQAAEPHYTTAAEFTRFAAAEHQRFGVVIREAGITAD
jgi:tripartite-type tricarboxylate transporter receptor subunit TctC